MLYTKTLRSRHKLKRMTFDTPKSSVVYEILARMCILAHLQPLPVPEIALEHGWRKAKTTIFCIYILSEIV